jgi:hypothetical protein
VSRFRMPAIGFSSSALADSHTTVAQSVAAMQTKMALRDLAVSRLVVRPITCSPGKETRSEAGIVEALACLERREAARFATHFATRLGCQP